MFSYVWLMLVSEGLRVSRNVVCVSVCGLIN